MDENKLSSQLAGMGMKEKLTSPPLNILPTSPSFNNMDENELSSQLASMGMKEKLTSSSLKRQHVIGDDPCNIEVKKFKPNEMQGQFDFENGAA
ncbi:unnamed protein product [Caenorhabditis brenneri]